MQLGAFLLDQPIGRGGMAEVWAARHPQTDAPVAIKVMNARLAGDPQFRRGFESEVRAVAALNHPGSWRFTTAEW